MDNGWIKLHRKLLDSSDWQLSTMEQKVVLITLLLLANHKEKEWEWAGNKYKVNSGEFVTSAKSIMKACGMGISRQNVRTALKRFEKINFLTTKSTNRGLLIKILNWDTYQMRDKEPNQPTNQHLTSSQPAPNQQLTTNKNVKNEKNDKNTYTDDFLQFWKLYPKKTGKGAAWKSWKRIKKGNGVFEKILTAVKAHKKLDQWSRDNGQYIPNPATWLNECRWEDELKQYDPWEHI